MIVLQKRSCVGLFICSSVAFGAPLARSAEPLLGSAEFFPSATHPVGERGDWTGLFPGARGVALEWDHRTGKNIVWKCRLPYWSNSSPIVVGKKAFVGSEPDELVCIDTGKGVVLWKKSIFIDQFIPEGDREAVRTALREANDEAQAVDVPGLVPAQWVAAIKPLDDAAVSETAKRIAEIRDRIKAKGLETGKISGAEDAGILSRSGEALLETHRLLVKRKDRSTGKPVGFFHGNWLYQAGFTMPTPASDGKFVWYQTGLGALGCLDLDGKVMWSIRTPTVGPTTDSFASCGSPVLIGERLFYTIAGKEVVAVEKATGREIWRFDIKKAGGNGRGSAGIVPLQVNGRDFIVFPARWILDAATGREVATIPFNSPKGTDARRGHTVAGGGESLITTVDMNIGRVRLGWNQGKLTTELIWSAKGPPWQCTVIYEENVYYPCGTSFSELAWVPLSGSGTLTPQKVGKFEPAWKIPESMRQAPAEGKKPLTVAQCWQYGAPAVADGHLFLGDDTQGMLVVKAAGAKSESVSRNFMDLFIRGNAFFQGNRMYVRSMHYLYCIGRTN